MHSREEGLTCNAWTRRIAQGAPACLDAQRSRAISGASSLLDQRSLAANLHTPLLTCTSLSQRTVFDVAVKPSGKVRSELHSRPVSRTEERMGAGQIGSGSTSCLAPLVLGLEW